MNIKRADFSRYLILHQYGGLYMDLDIELRRPVSEVIFPNNGSEPHLQFVSYVSREFELSGAPFAGNAFFASVANSSIIQDMIAHTMSFQKQSVRAVNDVLAHSGPMGLGVQVQFDMYTNMPSLVSLSGSESSSGQFSSLDLFSFCESLNGSIDSLVDWDCAQKDSEAPSHAEVSISPKRSRKRKLTSNTLTKTNTVSIVTPRPAVKPTKHASIVLPQATSPRLFRACTTTRETYMQGETMAETTKRCKSYNNNGVERQHSVDEVEDQRQMPVIRLLKKSKQQHHQCSDDFELDQYLESQAPERTTVKQESAWSVAAIPWSDRDLSNAASSSHLSVSPSSSSCSSSQHLSSRHSLSPFHTDSSSASSSRGRVSDSDSGSDSAKGEDEDDNDEEHSAWSKTKSDKNKRAKRLHEKNPLWPTAGNSNAPRHLFVGGQPHQQQQQQHTVRSTSCEPTKKKLGRPKKCATVTTIASPRHDDASVSRDSRESYRRDQLSSSISNNKPQPMQQQHWICERCTYINSSVRTKCEVCRTKRCEGVDWSATLTDALRSKKLTTHVAATDVNNTIESVGDVTTTTLVAIHHPVNYTNDNTKLASERSSLLEKDPTSNSTATVVTQLPQPQLVTEKKKRGRPPKNNNNISNIPRSDLTHHDTNTIIATHHNTESVSNNIVSDSNTISHSPASRHISQSPLSWSCAACTFANHNMFSNRCEMCQHLW
eukprot:gene26348-32915_t